MRNGAVNVLPYHVENITFNEISTEELSFNKHNTEALVALYSEDARIFSPGDIEPGIGRELIRKIYDRHFNNIPDVHNAVQNIIVEGDQGAVEFVASWKQATKENPMARGSLRIAAFITVKNGKIVEDIAYFDRMEMMEKMNAASLE